jgi:hypothetical protein
MHLTRMIECGYCDGIDAADRRGLSAKSRCVRMRCKYRKDLDGVLARDKAGNFCKVAFADQNDTTLPLVGRFREKPGALVAGAPKE